MPNGDTSYSARNSNEPWSLTTPDANTLRFEVRDDDYASGDSQNYTKNERSDVVFANSFPMSVPAEVNFNLNLESGPTNSASFLVLGQFSAIMSDGSNSATPPFDIDLIGDRLAVYVRYTTSSGAISGKTLYIGNAALVRGQSYNIDVKAIFDPSGNGRLVLSIDGNVVANYSGPLGYAGQQAAAWSEGINRGANATETIAADFVGTTFTTGDQVAALPDPVPYVAPPSLGVASFTPTGDEAGDISVNVVGYALGSTNVSIFSNGTLVATTAAAANGYYSATFNINGTGDHNLMSSYVTSTGQTSVSTAPTNLFVEVPNALSSGNPNIVILSMNGAMQGDSWWVQNAGKPWSITSPQAGTLRFEVRDNDVFINDKNHGTFSERSEIKDQTGIPNGTPIDVSYTFQIEPGQANDAQWCIIGQLHPGDVLNSPILVGPPFEVALAGEKMQINIVSTDANGTPYVVTLYTDVADIERGHNYSMEVKAVFDPSGNGRLVVIRDGVTLVDYSGSLGYAAQSATYWREGIYRSSSSTVTMAADYSNLSITSGASVTFPDKSQFIAAPTVTSESVAAAADSSGKTAVTMSGIAKANTTVSFYEDGTIVGSGNADANGLYAITANLSLSRAHYLSAVATDPTTGRSGISAVIVVDRAADVVANIASLQSGSNLNAIVLTDTSLITLPNSMSIGTFVKAYAGALSKIVGTFSFVKVTSATNQSYDTIKQYYSSTGVLTETDRLSGNSLVSTQVFAADGSQVSTAYSSSGISVAYVDKTGRTTESDLYTSAQILYSKTQYASDGSRLTTTYNSSNGVQTGYTSVSAIGVKQVATVNIQGQSYSSQILTYNPAGKLVKQERYTSSGVKTLYYALNDDGSNITQQFDPKTGAATTTTWRYADGTYATEVFQISNQPYSAKTTFYSAANKVVGTDTFDANGKLLTSTRLNSDSSTTVFAVDSQGNKTGYTQTFTDNSKAVALYATGQPGVLATLKLYAASGTLIETDLYNAAGQKISSDVYPSGGGDLLTTYDPSTGYTVGSIKTNADNSKVVTTFQPGVRSVLSTVSTYSSSGMLTETDRYNASAQKISIDIFDSSGGDLLTTYDPSSGYATGTTQTNADGSKVVTTYQPGAGTVLASVMTYNTSGALTETDLYNPAGQKVSSDIFASGGGDLLTTYDPSSGYATAAIQTNADASKVVTTYQPGGGCVLARVNTYSSSGMLTATDLYNSSGQKVATDVFAVDGSDVLTSYDPSTGYANSTTQTFADKTKRVTVFQPGSGNVLASIANYAASGLLNETEEFDSSGRLMEIDGYDTAGRKTSSVIRYGDGSRLTLTYDGASGAILQSSAVYADKSHTDVNNAVVGKPYTQQTASYNAAGKLIGLTRNYGDAAHTVALTQVTNSDGSTEVHNYDTSGRETSRTLTAADGSSDVFNSTYSGTNTNPATIQQTHYGLGNQKLWTDTTNANGTHTQVAMVAGASLTTHSSVSDTFTSATAGSDSFVFKPAFGQDIITNFHAGAGSTHDVVDLTALNLSRSSDQSSIDVLAQSLKQTGKDALLSINSADTILFKNTTVASLTKENFRV